MSYIFNISLFHFIIGLTYCYPIQNNSVLRYCCDEETSSLLACTLNRVSKNYAKAANGIALVTYITPDIFDYAAYSLTINAAYAEHRGYKMKILSPSTQSEYDRLDQRWNKVMILLNAIGGSEGTFQNGWGGSDVIVWMDADLVVVDMEFTFESILASHPTKDIIISEDPYPDEIFSIANTGCIIVRNTPWSQAFLKAWWASPNERVGVWDQHVFTKLYSEDMGDALIDVPSHIQLLPADAINTKRPAIDFHLPHNPILHMVGSVSAHRISVFSVGVQNLCAHLHHPSTPLPRQLGLTKEVLREVETSIVGSKGDRARKLLFDLTLLTDKGMLQPPGSTAHAQFCSDKHTLATHKRTLFDILKLGDARSGPEKDLVMQCLTLYMNLTMGQLNRPCFDPSSDLHLTMDEQVLLMQQMQWVLDTAFEISINNSPEVVRGIMAAMESIISRLDGLAEAVYGTCQGTEAIKEDGDCYSRQTPLYYAFKRHDFLATSYTRQEEIESRGKQDAVASLEEKHSSVLKLVHMYRAIDAWREMTRRGGTLQTPRALDEAVFMFFRIGLEECASHTPVKGIRSFSSGISTLERHWRTDGRTPQLMPSHLKAALAQAYRQVAMCIAQGKHNYDPFEMGPLVEIFSKRSIEVTQGQYDSDDAVLTYLDKLIEIVETSSKGEANKAEIAPQQPSADKMKKMRRRKAKVHKTSDSNNRQEEL